MRTQLVSIPTATTPLDGALHLPDGPPTAGAVLLFHGNTMNFYIGAPRFLPARWEWCLRIHPPTGWGLAHPRRQTRTWRWRSLYPPRCHWSNRQWPRQLFHMRRLLSGRNRQWLPATNLQLPQAALPLNFLERRRQYSDLAEHSRRCQQLLRRYQRNRWQA